MTKRAKGPEQFRDVQIVLDTLLERGGGIWRLETRGQAIYYRQRMYRFRAALRREVAKAILPGQVAETVYDSMKISYLKDRTGKAEDESALVVEFKTTVGKLETLGGDTIEMEKEEFKKEEMSAEDRAVLDFIEDL